MVKKDKKKTALISTDKVVADNKRANFDYAVEDRFDAGIMLVGTEVKSLRHGQCMLAESHVGLKEGALHLLNAHIPEYQQASQLTQHDPRRPRKLLLKQKEIDKLMGSVTREGYTIIPIKLYFDKKGLAKLEIGLAKGKKQQDKRQDKKDKDWARNKARIMRDKG